MTAFVRFGSAPFHNLRLLSRMKKPNYSEPAIGWNQEDMKTGVIEYGVANYEPRQSAAPITAPIRPAHLALPEPPCAGTRLRPPSSTTAMSRFCS